MRLGSRGWRAARVAAMVGAAVLAGVIAWALGPRLALAVMVGTAAAGGLLIVDRLRGLQAVQRELRTSLNTALPALEKRLRAELSAAERRLRAAFEADLGGSEKRLRAELSAVERRLRVAGSGDLAALEKRLRGVGAAPAVPDGEARPADRAPEVSRHE